MPIQSTVSFVPTKPAPEETSGRCTTPGRSSQLVRPDMVSPSTDDLRRRALSEWAISNLVDPREKRGHSVGSDSSAHQSDGSMTRKSKVAKMYNCPSGEDLSVPNAVQSSSRVTLDSPQAGSEDDHQKVKKISRNLDAHEKACLLAYYDEPFYLKTEDRSKPALNYPCRFCTGPWNFTAYVLRYIIFGKCVTRKIPLSAHNLQFYARSIERKISSAKCET